MLYNFYSSRLWSNHSLIPSNDTVDDPINDPINDTAKPSMNTKDDGTSIWIFKNGYLEMGEKTAPELLRGWVWTKVRNVCDLINGRAFKPSEWSSKGLPIIRIQNLNNITADFNYCDFEVEDKYSVNNEQLLFAWSGTPGTSFGAHIWNRGKAVLNQHIFKVKINEKHLNKSFFMHLINNNIGEYIRKAHGTAGLAHITKNKFENSVVAIPPLPEQRRIITKIEELFTRLDAGVVALTTAKAQLKHYRQSVLKSACEGRLVPTEAELARAEGRDYEPADVLLARIGKERREKWDAEKKQKGRRSAKYTEPAAPDVGGLPGLPEGWCWVNVDSFTVLGPQNGLYLPKSAYGGGVSIIRIDDFQDDSSRSAHELHQVNADQNDIRKYSLMKNDLVINRVNSPTHLGKCLVVAERNLPSIFESNMMRLWLSAFVNPFFIGFYLRSVSGKKRLISNAKWAVNQASINQKDVVSTPVPLPPLPEQQRIVAEIERRLSVADEIEKTVDQSLKQAERLRQSILKRAFEGKLISQDPNDEPASVLLEQILLHKAMHEKNNKPKRRKTRG